MFVLHPYNLSARAGSLCWDISGLASAGRQLDIPGGISIICFWIYDIFWHPAKVRRLIWRSKRASCIEALYTTVIIPVHRHLNSPTAFKRENENEAE